MTKNVKTTTSFISFQVYEEKEKMWERELRKIKGLYDNRLRASQQKSSKMEQALTNQNYQVIRKKSFHYYMYVSLSRNIVFVASSPSLCVNSAFVARRKKKIKE